LGLGTMMLSVSVTRGKYSVSLRIRISGLSFVFFTVFLLAGVLGLEGFRFSRRVLLLLFLLLLALDGGVVIVCVVVGIDGVVVVVGVVATGGLSLSLGFLLRVGVLRSRRVSCWLIFCLRSLLLLALVGVVFVIDSIGVVVVPLCCLPIAVFGLLSSLPSSVVVWSGSTLVFVLRSVSSLPEVVSFLLKKSVIGRTPSVARFS
jgi:hypothetical protein